MVPSSSAMVLASPASSTELVPASSQRSSPKNAPYQRSDRPGGGNSSDFALEKDIVTTMMTGRQRKASTRIATTPSHGLGPRDPTVPPFALTSARAAIDKARRRAA